jgi:protein-disulfide isomerase
MNSFAFRPLAVVCALAPLLCAQAAKPPAFDKSRFESWARHLFVWGDGINVSVSDPQPSSVPGFSKVTLRGSVGNQSQEETFLVSDDGQNILRGSVFDVKQNPFKSELGVLDTKDQPALGTAGAPVVISIYSDFQCPYCREAAKSLRANLLQTYPKEVRLYFHDFPLDQLHPWARTAAQYGRCIYKQNPDAFWTYHDWIFETQPKITAEGLRPQILEFMKGKGVDTNAVDQCASSGMTAADISRTEKQGHALDVSSTPTLFINGRKMVGAIPWETLKTVIDYEIKYQKTAKNAGDDCGCAVTLPLPGAAPQGPASKPPKN